MESTGIERQGYLFLLWQSGTDEKTMPCEGRANQRAVLRPCPNGRWTTDKQLFEKVWAYWRQVQWNLLLDTRSTQTLIRTDMLPAEAQITGETSVICTLGDVQKYPKAEVNIRMDGRSFYVWVGVLDNLPVAVLIGQDLLPPIMKKPLVKYKERRHCLVGEWIAGYHGSMLQSVPIDWLEWITQLLGTKGVVKLHLLIKYFFA